MAGPSDAFFRDVVRAVGGDLAGNLPELEKRQAAAAILGGKSTLAEIAQQMGLIDRAKLDELGALEKGKGSGSSAGPKPTKTPTARTEAVPAPAAAPAPKKRLRDRAKQLSSHALTALASVGRKKKPAAAAAETAEAREQERETARKNALMIASLAFAAAALLAGAVWIAMRPSGPDGPPPPPPGPEPMSAEAVAAAKAASELRQATMLGGDRDPNWWAKREKPIDVPTNDLAGNGKPAPSTPSQPSAPSDTAKAFMKEHRVGSLRFQAHARWQEVSASSTSCMLIDDATVPAALTVLLVPKTGAAPADLVAVVKRALPAGAKTTETTPCHEKIGGVSATGAGFDFDEAGYTHQVRCYTLDLKNEHIAVILRAPKDGEARQEIGKILTTLQ